MEIQFGLCPRRGALKTITPHCKGMNMGRMFLDENDEHDKSVSIWQR